MPRRNKPDIELHEIPGFEALPAVVVADKTDKLGKRLGYLAIGLLVLFFAISGYIQSARNGADLRDAEESRDMASRDRATLALAVDRISAQLDEDRDIILELAAVVNEQNRRLLAAGLDPVEFNDFRDLPEQIPSAQGEEDTPGPTPEASSPPAPRRPIPDTAAPAPPPEPAPAPTPSQPSEPEPEPDPEPEPEPPGPLGTVCDLTGICLN